MKYLNSCGIYSFLDHNGNITTGYLHRYIQQWVFVSVDLLVNILLFFSGFVILYFSVDYLIDILEDYLADYNVSPAVFGFVILGIDLEESLVSVFAAVDQLPYLSIGNLIGNTILAIVIAFSIPVLLVGFKIETVPSGYYYLLGAAAINLFLSLLLSTYLYVFGIIALSLFIIALYLNLQIQLDYDRNATQTHENVPQQARDNFMKQSLTILILLIFVFLGGELLITGASNIIKITALSESFFGLVIMAFITNAEEFWLMFTSINKDQVKLGISTQLGKIFWNISLIFGISAMIIGGFQVDTALLLSGILFLAIITILIFSLYRKKLDKKVGVLLFSIALIFLSLNILRVIPNYFFDSV